MFHCLVGIVLPIPVGPSWKSSVLQLSEASAYTEMYLKLGKYECFGGKLTSHL